MASPASLDLLKYSTIWNLMGKFKFTRCFYSDLKLRLLQTKLFFLYAITQFILSTPPAFRPASAPESYTGENQVGPCKCRNNGKGCLAGSCNVHLNFLGGTSGLCKKFRKERGGMGAVWLLPLSASRLPEILRNDPNLPDLFFLVARMK